MDQKNCKSSLFIGDLAIFCTEEDIRQTFSPFGKITEIKIMKSEETSRNLSYGFIKFATEANAKKAMNDLNGLILCGRPLRIRWASYKSKMGNKGKEENETSPIHVSFISYQIDKIVTEESLRTLFSTYGYVVDTSIKKSLIDKEGGRQSGYGFVHFATTPEGIESAIVAAEALNDMTVENVNYKCSISHKLNKALNNINSGGDVNNGGYQGDYYNDGYNMQNNGGGYNNYGADQMYHDEYGYPIPGQGQGNFDRMNNGGNYDPSYNNYSPHVHHPQHHNNVQHNTQQNNYNRGYQQQTMLPDYVPTQPSLSEINQYATQSLGQGQTVSPRLAIPVPLPPLPMQQQGTASMHPPQYAPPQPDQVYGTTPSMQQIPVTSALQTQAQQLQAQHALQQQQLLQQQKEQLEFLQRQNMPISQPQQQPQYQSQQPQQQPAYRNPYPSQGTATAYAQQPKQNNVPQPQLQQSQQNQQMFQQQGKQQLQGGMLQPQQQQQQVPQYNMQQLPQHQQVPQQQQQQQAQLSGLRIEVPHNPLHAQFAMQPPPQVAQSQQQQQMPYGTRNTVEADLYAINNGMQSMNITYASPPQQYNTISPPNMQPQQQGQINYLLPSFPGLINSQSNHAQLPMLYSPDASPNLVMRTFATNMNMISNNVMSPIPIVHVQSASSSIQSSDVGSEHLADNYFLYSPNPVGRFYGTSPSIMNSINSILSPIQQQNASLQSGSYSPVYSYQHQQQQNYMQQNSYDNNGVAYGNSPKDDFSTNNNQQSPQKNPQKGPARSVVHKRSNILRKLDEVDNVKETAVSPLGFGTILPGTSSPAKLSPRIEIAETDLPIETTIQANVRPQTTTATLSNAQTATIEQESPAAYDSADVSPII